MIDDPGLEGFQVAVHKFKEPSQSERERERDTADRHLTKTSSKFIGSISNDFSIVKSSCGSRPNIYERDGVGLMITKSGESVRELCSLHF